MSSTTQSSVQGTKDELAKALRKSLQKQRVIRDALAQAPMGERAKLIDALQAEEHLFEVLKTRLSLLPEVSEEPAAV